MDDTEVSLTLRTSGPGLHAELRARDPDVDWETMSNAAYRRRVSAFFVEAIDFQVDGRRLRARPEALSLGHEVRATFSVHQAAGAGIEAFTLDLTDASSRRNQHNLVFVTHDERRERYMLHRAAQAGQVLHWASEESAP